MPDRPREQRARTWARAVIGATRDGSVRVRLSRQTPRATLDVTVSPRRGVSANALAITRVGDVTYQAPSGLGSQEAAALTTSFAARLDAAPAWLLESLPHLCLGPESPSREALAEAWERAAMGPVPNRIASLALDPSEVRAALEAALASAPAGLAGYHLDRVEPTSDGCLLVLQAPGDACSLHLGRRTSPTQGFGHSGALAIEPRAELSLEQARACSRLALLLALVQGESFEAREPGRISSASLSALSFAIEASGYVIVKSVVAEDELAALREAADRAIAAVRRAVAAGARLEYTFYDLDVYVGSRCLYCWSEACVRLLDHELVHRVAAALMGRYKLFDMTVHSALPAAAYGRTRTERWHRDIDVLDPRRVEPRYAWFMICLDDFTAENGATWVVPGSHRMPSVRNLPQSLEDERYSTRTQLVASAGDVIVLNPSTLHTVGHNATDRPRRMINVGVCRADVRQLLDHWAIAGPAIRERATERTRMMLSAERERPLDMTWSVLPDGWETRADELETTRVFPEEQRESFQPTTLSGRVD